ncbi:MAG: pyruvate kinase [Planctomycetota bacterium]|jgi:pyruvate kinase
MQMTHFSKTGIIATLGPASESPEMIREFIRHRVSTFRLNFSHGTFDTHKQVLDNINQVRGEFTHSVSVMGDLCGPKIRIGSVEPGTVLADDQEVTITVGDELGTADHFTTTYTGLIDDIDTGQRILVDDGQIVLGVLSKTAEAICCKVLVGGPLSSHKGMNLPDTRLSTTAITEKDWQCVDWAIENNLDYLALSFVQYADEIRQLKQYIADKGSRIQVIPKIEKPLAVENIESIINVSDAILIARGDLGVEMDLARVPLVQKKITAMCRRLGKPVIVATQVLQSMIENASPTRAEASDVSNAVLDYADVLMLSGETAVGKYPIDAVKTIGHLSRTTEAFLEDLNETRPRIEAGPELAGKAALARTVAHLLDEVKTEMVVGAIRTRDIASLLGKARIDVPFLALCADELVARQISLNYGILSVHDAAAPKSLKEWIARVDQLVLDNRWADKGDKLLLIPPLSILSESTSGAIMMHEIGK